MQLPAPPLLVTCTSYAGFMVKERSSEGAVGDKSISVVPMRREQQIAACDEKTAPGELILATDDLDYVMFWGAWGSYLFLDSHDGDSYRALAVSIFRDDSATPVVTMPMLDDPPMFENPLETRLSPLPGGFEFHLWVVQPANCALATGTGAGLACIAELDRVDTVKTALSQCLQMMHRDLTGNPWSIPLPILLTVRGRSSQLRLSGTTGRCIRGPDSF
jgi:hypothetical protein